METDAILTERAAANMAAMWSHAALASGGRVEHWDDAVAVDARAPNPVMNRVVLTAPDPSAPEDLVARATRFYGGTGRPWGIIDPWGSLDLTAHGLVERVRLPSMALLPQNRRAPSPGPDGLRIRAVDDASTLLDFKRLLFRSFTFVTWPADATTLFDERFIAGEDVRAWVATLDGEVVGTAAAAVHADVAGVYLIAVAPEHRNKRIGEAVSWVASSAGGDTPAVLQASSMGLPVYRRMGYHHTGECVFWTPPAP